MKIFSSENVNFLIKVYERLIRLRYIDKEIYEQTFSIKSPKMNLGLQAWKHLKTCNDRI